MKLLERKEKNTIAVQTEEGKVYLGYDKDSEAEYLKYAVHMVSNNLFKAVYKLEPYYFFLTRADDEITVQHREIADTSAATYEINDFFESRATETFEDSDIPKIRQNPLSDRRFVLIIALIATVIMAYSAFKITEPKTFSGILKRNPAPTPIPLSDNEKKSLKLIGSRLLVGKISEIISSVRSDPYQRIDAMSVQENESPQNIEFIITAGKEYLYPEIDTVRKSHGLYGKTITETVRVERKDIRHEETADFNVCAAQMLERGFNVTKRDSTCVNLSYEGDATKVIGAYGAFIGCNLFLNSLNVNSGGGKLDVSFCR